MANTRLNLPLSQVLDLRGKPIVGARLYIYDTGTTTLSTTYSNAALTVTNTNPLIADSYGMFGDVFATLNATYDLFYKTTTDALIKQYNSLSIQFPIDVQQNLKVNTDITENFNIIAKTGLAEGQGILSIVATGSSVVNTSFFRVDGGGVNGTVGAFSAQKNSVNNRSINTAGTINANGADYAEYVKKSSSCGVIAKGQIAGINVNGELTDKYSESIHFLVKSTNPNLVGGDGWGAGLTPEQANIERLHYDRMAFCGVTPIIYTGFTVGDYCIPVLSGTDNISVSFVATPTFEQYKISVGRVAYINSGGKAVLNVKAV